MQLEATLIEKIIDAVYRAGDAILEVQSKLDTIETEVKADNSPVTIADRKAHDILDEVLAATGIPVLSEEGAHARYEERREWDLLWVVDPLDGTKEFIRGRSEFTVNVGLVQGETPIFGIVYAPVLNWIYVGGQGVPAMKSVARISYAEMLEQAQRIPMRYPEQLTVVASRSHMSASTEALLSQWESEHGAIERVSMGSSLKICLVAEGRAHAYPRVAPTMEWDTAAGHAVAIAAGCSVFQVEEHGDELSWSKPLVYNKENLLNPYFLICGAPYLCGHA